MISLTSNHSQLRIALSIVLLIVLACGLPGLRINANYSAYFDDDDSARVTHQELSEAFSEQDSFVVALEFASGEALSAHAIEQLHAVVEAVRVLPRVTQVRSVLDLNADDHADPEHDPLIADLLGIEATAPAAPSLDHARVTRDPRAAGLLVAHDQSALLLDIELELPPHGDTRALLDTLAQIRSSAARAVTDPAVRLRYSGALALNAAYVDVVRSDLQRFLPALILIVTLALSLLFKSTLLAALMMSLAAVTVIAAFGLGGWLQLELAAIVAFSPVIIASLTLAGSVHLVSRFIAARTAGSGVAAAAATSLEENFWPLTLTSATTAAGFLALMTSPSPPIRTMGLLVAGGIALGWMFNLVLLPSALRVLGSRLAIRAPYRFGLLRLVDFSSANADRMVVFFLAVMLLSVALVRGNTINDSVFDYFPSTHPFRTDTAFIQQRFSGINKLTFSVGRLQPYSVFDAALLQQVEHFSDWLETQDEVRNVLTLTDLPRVKERLSGADADATLKRYRALAEAHPPAALGAEQLINRDFSALAIHVYLDELDAAAITDFEARAMDWLHSNAAANVIRGAAGSSVVFAHLGQSNARSMILAFGAALAIIALLCARVIGSSRGACVGLLCNLFPVIAVYAGWALIDGHISIGGAVVLGMILGIVVDDTLYLLIQYRRLARAGAAAPVAQAISEVGPALVITSITLCAGLSVGILSSFGPIVAMSGLSVAVIATALFTDLLALPALLSQKNTSKSS